MIRVIFLGIGTLLAVLFILQLKRGEHFESALTGVEGMEYPLCDLYMVGFAWSEQGLLRFRGSVAASLKSNAALLYDPKFAEYYANIAWVQCITYVHLLLTLTFLLAGVFYSSRLFVLFAGLFFTVLAGVYSITNMKNKLSARQTECENQLPEVASTMAVLLNSGMVLRDVWALVSKNGTGAIHELMRNATENMNTGGMTESDAIYNFGRLTGSGEIKKFTSAMLQSMEKGGNELVGFMQQQSSELWHMKRQRMLQGGEKAATKLLLPTMLIFVGVIVIVMTAAFGGSLF